MFQYTFIARIIDTNYLKIRTIELLTYLKSIKLSD